MPVQYLHGTEELPVEAGVREISVVRSSVIALVGTAPAGGQQSLILVQKNSDLAQFGAALPGFTIPQSLKLIFANQPTQVLVVNVYDSAQAAVTKETVVIANGKGKLANPQKGALTTWYQSNGTTTVAAVLGTDYSIDVFGNIKVLSTLLADATYKITYNKYDTSGIDAGDIIGNIDGDGIRTGMALFQQAYATFGFKPKQMIVPGYSNLVAVQAALATAAGGYKALYYTDAPIGTTLPDIQSSRGPAGPVDAFNVADKRDVLFYPMPLAYDEYSDTNIPQWYSAAYAGLVAYVDAQFGYHFSPSNHKIGGVVGLELPITFDISDQTGTTDANVLNSLGIVTIANSFGTGLLSWGNRNSSFPGNTAADSFIPNQRVRDMVEESIAFAMQPYMDLPLSVADIDSVIETVNTFFRELIGRDALVDGSNCKLDPDANTPTTLAAGQVTFFLTFMSPTPGERFTFKSFMDTSLLGNILAGVTA